MRPPFECHGLTKHNGAVTALDQVTLRLGEGSLVGLIGRNGSGKTTLLHHAAGLVLPSSGSCRTLGVASGELTSRELAQIGFVPQDVRLLGWLRVESHVAYVASFYDRWDRNLEARLFAELELDPGRRVGELSKGDLQKLALILAVCHRPKLLLLDEPVSAFDPIARERLLRFLMERLAEDGSTIIISSHVLRDVERVVDHVLCLHRGALVADASLDELQETYVEWEVAARGEPLPSAFPEPFILEQQVNCRSARLEVHAGAEQLEEFRRRHQVEVVVRPLSLDRIFPWLLGGAR